MKDHGQQAPIAAVRGPEEAGTVPLWVKVFEIVAALLVALFVVLHFVGLSPTRHGP
jgi:hypothetical protein